MIGARGYPRQVAIALAISFLVFFPSLTYSQSTMPSNWEAKYTTLKNDLRALAIDPLDPQVLFIGSDQQVLLSTDGGNTWQDSQSVRNDKISISAAGSSEAERLILLIAETDAVQAAPGPAGEAPAEAEAEDIQNSVEEKEETLTEVTGDLTSARSKQDEKANELRAAEAELTEAQAALSGWSEDPLTPGEVDSLPVEDGYMEDSDLEKLRDWLSQRGLSESDDPEATKQTLIDYLGSHAEEGARLREAVRTAEEKVAEKQSSLASAEDELARLQSEEKTAEADKKSAEKRLDTVEADLDTARSGETSATLPETESISGATYMTVDPSNPDNVFLATFNGVYKSVDRGLSWEQVYQGLNPTQSATIYLTVDPSNPDTIFAGTLSGIAVSRDGGDTWERPAGRVSDKVISALAVHPFDSQVVLAGTEGKGAFRSLDGGNTWENCFSKASADANSIQSLVFAPSEPGIIYAGTEGGIFRSDDGGSSWDTIAGMGISTPEVRDVIVSPVDPDTVFIATRRGVFGTDNGGRLWRRLTFGTIYQGANFLSFDPLNPGLVWLLTDNRLFQSADRLCQDLSAGEAVLLAGSCDLTLDGSETHSLTVDQVDEETGTVKITIESEPQTVELEVGESTEIDLDGDGETDLDLTLDSIDDGLPKFSARKIAPIVTEEEKTAELKSPDQITGLEDLEPYFRHEPTWVEVQQAASRWAEVHPDKIASWRRGASLRAFLPEVRFEYSLARSWSSGEGTREETNESWDNLFEIERDEFEETKSGDVFKTQYDYSDDTFTFTDEFSSSFSTDATSADLRNWGSGYSSGILEESDSEYSRDRDYGLRLIWELGDFLYNSEQRHISREARDLVELRQDVLEQVTLYYFDRRSARIDMILNPPSDPYSRVEMLLRIQQLNASLDTLTGGYFTEAIRAGERADSSR